MKRNSILIVGLVALLSSSAFAGSPQSRDDGKTFLTEEARQIHQEGRRISGEAQLMRSEAQRLSREAEGLRTGAARLDAIWQSANRANPEEFADYAGRDKSQQRMRSDAQREDRDADGLRLEGRRLDEEADRLSDLAAAVNSEAQKSLIDRFRGCCKSGDLTTLREQVAALARSMGVTGYPFRMTR